MTHFHQAQSAGLAPQAISGRSVIVIESELQNVPCVNVHVKPTFETYFYGT